MKIIFIIFLIFLLFLITLLIIPLKLQFFYDKDETQNTASIYLKYGFVTKKLSGKDKKESGSENGEKTKEEKSVSFENKKKKIDSAITFFNETKGTISDILEYISKKSIEVEEITFISDFGFENAMHTGIFTGLYNGIVYSVLGLIHHHLLLKNMEVKLNPNFQKPCFIIHSKCILKIKTVHTIIIAFGVLKLWKKWKKEGRN